MEHNMNNFDDLFREASAGYAETPPPAVWEALEKRLDNKKRRVFPLRWFWYFSIVSFLTLLGASIAWNTTRNAGTASSVALHTHINEPVASNTHIPATPSVTSVTNDTHDKTKATTNNTATKKYTSHKAKTKHTTNTIAYKTLKHNTNKANKLYNTSNTKDNKDIAKPSESDNAPTVGTSAYSYDDFEETKPTETLAEAAPMVPASPLGTGYVTNKIKKHHIVAVEMTPAPQEVSNSTQVKETEVAANISSTTSTTEQRDDIALAAAVRNTSAKRNEPKTATKEAHKHTATGKKQKATSTVSNAVAPAAKSIDNKTVAMKATKKAQTAGNGVKSTGAKTGNKEISQTAVATVNNKTTKEVKQPAKATEKTALASNSTHEKVAKIPVTETKALTTSVSTKQPVAATVPATKPVNNTVPATKTAATQKAQIQTVSKAIGQGNKAQKTNDIAVTTTATTSTSNKQPAIVKETNVTANKHADAKQTATSVTKTSVVKKIKKANKHSNAIPANQYAAATKNTVATQPIPANLATDVATTNTAQKPIKETNKAKSKHIGKAPSTASTTANTLTPAATPKAKTAAKPVTSMAVVANNQNKATKTNGGTTTNEDAEETNTTLPLASAPTVAKAAEEKKPETTKALATENKKADEPTVEKTATTDSAKGEEPEALRRFMAGIKGGYEGGMRNTAANKAIIAPYFQYNIGGKFSLMLQPSFKASHLNKHAIGNTASYYDVTAGSGKYSLHDSAMLYFPLTGDTLWRRNYTYTENYNSIAKSYSVKGTYFEVELPILVSYSITPKFSVYGGLNTVYSKLPSIKEDTHTEEGLTATGNPYTLAKINAPAPTPTTTGIVYSGSPISGYTGPLYPEQKGSSFRMGYMLGFSYEIRKRWMADILLQQTFIKPNYQAGYNVNSALSLPYVRFTLGYRLTK